MPIDLNMDMGALVKGLINKRRNASVGAPATATSGKVPITAYKVAIIISVIMLLVTVVYVSFVYIPLKEKNHKKSEELNKVLEMKKQLSSLDEQILNLKRKLDKSKEEYIESLSHFGGSDDLGDLYQVVSTLASKYNLVVLNVKEIAPPPPPPPVTKSTANTGGKEGAGGEKKGDKSADPKAAAPTTTASATAMEPKKPAVNVKESKVELELKGHYGEYIKFKEDLAVAAALLKVNSESIIVKNETTEQGSIYVKLNLSTYAIDKKPFEGIITEKENENTK